MNVQTPETIDNSYFYEDAKVSDGTRRNVQEMSKSSSGPRQLITRGAPKRRNSQVRELQMREPLIRVAV